MKHLLAVSAAIAVVGYVVVTAVALYFLARFRWLTCVQEVRPRQLSRHLLAYGVVLAYVCLCVWGQYRSTIFRQEGVPSSPARRWTTRESSGDGTTDTGAVRRVWRVVVACGGALLEAFLRPWTPVALPSTTTASSAAAAAPPSSLLQPLFTSVCYALAQALAATALYGTFAVLSNARWRHTALRTVERHPELWAALFPTGLEERAQQLQQQQHQLDTSADSLTWSAQVPPRTPTSAATAATGCRLPGARRSSRVQIVGLAVRAPGRHSRPPSRSQLALPRFSNTSSSGASGSVSRGLAVPPLHPGAVSTFAEEADGLQQRRKLLRLRQHFMAAFWMTDTVVLLMTFSFFSTLAACRVVVTVAFASLSLSTSSTTTTPAAAAAAGGLALIPSPTEGYVALMGIGYLTVLRWRLHSQRALLHELVRLFTTNACRGCCVAADGATGGSPSLSSIPLPRQRRTRLVHNNSNSNNNTAAAGASGGGGRVEVARASLRRPTRGPPRPATASSPHSPVTPTDLLYKPGFDDATFSGMVSPSVQDPAQVALQASALHHTPSTAFYLNQDARVTGASSSSHAATAAAAAATATSRAESPSPPSFFARWSFRLLPLCRHASHGGASTTTAEAAPRRGASAGDSPVLSLSSFPVGAATTPAAATVAGTRSVVPEVRMPHADYVLAVTAALLALQLCPTSHTAWAVAILVVGSGAVGSARQSLFGPVRWVVVDYRSLLQCSWWTLLVARAFTPRSMDVSKAVQGLSQQQRRHLMVLQAVGTHHAHSSPTMEEDEDWVTEEATGSFAANALVAAATTTPPPAALRARRTSTSASASGGAGAGAAATTTVTPDLLTTPRAADSAETASLSASSAATAVAILSGSAGGGRLADYEALTRTMDYPPPRYNEENIDDSAEYDDDMTDDSGRFGNGGGGGGSSSSGVVTAIPPAQFWHGVATKVLQQSAAAADGGCEDGTGGHGCLTGSFAGPASTALTGSFAGLPSLPGVGVSMVQVGPNTSSATAACDTPTTISASTVANTSFLGVVDPFRVVANATVGPSPSSSATTSSATVIANALMPITPGMEVGSTARAVFRKEMMRGSMLLTAPAAARVGAAAEREEQEAEAARQRELEQLRREEDDDAEAELLAANAARALNGAMSEEEEEDQEERDIDAPSAHSLKKPYRFALDNSTAPLEAEASTEEEEQPSATAAGGWLSRALATVVPGIVGHRSRTGSTTSSAASHASHHSVLSSSSFPSTPAASGEPFTSELPDEVVQSFSFAGSFSGAASATARALLHSEEGFARFLSSVRRDGDNTYGLQGLLASHGHTYARRVDAKGRSALHYAVMGGFVHGVWFLVNIGAEPNLLDKAGYAPLHYAVLYHTEHCLSPTITDENGSKAVQGARHMLGIPVVGTASMQAPEQARKRRRLRQQKQRRQMQEQLQAAYTAESSSRSVLGDSSTATNHDSHNDASTTSDTSCLASSNGAAAQQQPVHEDRSRRSSDGSTTTTTHHTSTIPNASNSTPLGVPEGDVPNNSIFHLLPTGTPDDTEDAAATTSAAPVSSVAVMAAAMAQEERGQWYGMVGRLLSLGALVDFPTARGLTALHLAVLQGSIGLINTLLREGANPLLGSELETPSFLATANAAPWEVVDDAEAQHAAAERDCSMAWIAQVHAEFQHPGARQRQQQQKLQEKEDKQSGGGGGGQTQSITDGGRVPSSCGSQSSAPSTTSALTAAAIVRRALLAKQTEWVEVHVTNAGNPIAKGHCKSPLLLAVELDADLAVASMLHHATLQATTAASVMAGLPGVCTSPSAGVPSRVSASGGGGCSGLEEEEEDSGPLPTSSVATSHPPPSPLVGAGGQLPPLAPSAGTSLSPAPTSTLRSTSAYSKEPSFTAAYPGSTNPHRDGAAGTNANENDNDNASTVHVSFSANLTTATTTSPAAVAALLPLPTAITAVESNNNNSSTADVFLSSTAGVTVETIATSITAAASTRARLCWERPCAHAFNPVHVALVLGNAQVTRVLLLRWAYDGTNRGGTLPLSAAVASGENAKATLTCLGGISGTPLSGAAAAAGNGSRTSSGVGQHSHNNAATTASTTTGLISPLLSSFPQSLANAADSTTVVEPLQPTVAQITVPVYDDGEHMAFLNATRALDGDAGSKERDDADTPTDAAAAAAGESSVVAAGTPSSHHHHHHVRDPATATLSLLTSIGASAFWVVPLRLNFFHLAAIGDSTECLAYVLRWRGVPDYIPCTLDDAFQECAQAAEEARSDADVRPSATAAQDAYHRRRSHHRQQKKLGNHHNTRGPAGVASPLRPPTAAASTTLPGASPGMDGEGMDTAPGHVAGHHSIPRSFLDGVPIVSEEDFPESPSSSSDSTASSRRRSDGGAAVVEGKKEKEKEEGQLRAPPSFFSASLPTGDVAGGANMPTTMAARDLEAATVSSTASDFFNRTWSSGRRSADTASSGTAAGPPPSSRSSRTYTGANPPTGATVRRAHRLRAHQHTYMRALVTLLQTNLRRDAVRRRVRTTVFGRGGAGAVLRNLPPTSAAAAAADAAGGGESGGGTAVTAASAALSGEPDSVMAQTCFGSTTAAAALHTGMTICYATMNNLLQDEPFGEVTDNDDSTSTSSSDEINTNSSSSSSTTGGNANAGVKEAGALRQSEKVRVAELVQDRLKERRVWSQARQLREEARLHHLRQQRQRAFVSAVAKLRQSIVGVPIDIAHLAAVEMAVDRACAALPTAKTRRVLQQALLIVTRRLQHQRRRQYLIDGMRQAAAAAASSSPTAARGSLCSIKESGTADEGEGSFSTTTTTDSRVIPSCRSTPKALQEIHGTQRQQRRRSSSSSSTNYNNNVRVASTNASRPVSTSQKGAPQSPSMATSAPSYYSTGDRYGGRGFNTATGDEDDEDDEGNGGAAAADHDTDSVDVRHERFRRFQQQQRLLMLLSALATELNAVDTRGLTPLHYAIANQNASMVYLLCAYGATFIFASPQTEEHLVGHPVEVVAAAAVAAYEGAGSEGSATGTAAAAAAAATAVGGGGGAWTCVNVKDAASSGAASPLFPLPTTAGVSPSSQSPSPTGLAAVRAQLAAPGITVATDVLAFFSEQYFAHLTPATQEALRRAAKTGSAEYLLLRLPTRSEQEVERQALAQEAARHAVDGMAVGGGSGYAQPHQRNATLPPFAPSPAATPAVGIAAAALTSSPPSSCSSFSSPLLHQQQQPPSLKQSFAQPTTMAATLTEALGLGVNGSFTAVAASALSAAPGEGAETRSSSSNSNNNSTAHSKNDVLPTTTPATTVIAAVVEGAAGVSAKGLLNAEDSSLHGLQAQLVDQEDLALQRMVTGGGGGGGDALRSSINSGGSCNANANKYSIAIPLPSPVSITGLRGSVDGQEGDRVVDSVRGVDQRSIVTGSSSTGTGGDGALAPVTPLMEGALHGTPSSLHASRSSATAAAAVTSIAVPAADTVSKESEYAVLEPHDVFLTHMVRNPARADSIVRAAMEGTALRYLFQASIASSALET